jgi:glycosyltransferase involved in cell wall biosynthesis
VWRRLSWSALKTLMSCLGSVDARLLRIACNGPVARDAGSMPSANFAVLQELLDRGHEVDFFSKRSFVYPEQLLDHERFRYVECSTLRLDRAAERLRGISRYTGWAAGWMNHAAFARQVMRRMGAAHATHRYDVELFLGTWAFDRLAGVPVVSWVQGAPGSDSRSIARHAGAIKRLCGRRVYTTLRLYSIFRDRFALPPFSRTDVAITGSRWSAAVLTGRYGIPPHAVRSIPYPVDLKDFSPAGATDEPDGLELAWVGRIVPRKRLDLFLDAGAQLIDAGRDVRLTIVGSFLFADGFRRLFDAFPFPDRLTYVPRMPRADVRALLQRTTVLVQPSEDEDFGSSVAESLACGTPVVVGPTNGTGEYVDGGGVHFERYDARSVAAAIAEVLDRLAADPAKMRAQARQDAERHFTAQAVVDALEGTFRDLLAGHARSAGVTDG